MGVTYELSDSSYLPNNQFDICDVYGKIFVEVDPIRADFRVYEEDSEAFADIVVFEQENTLYSDQPGYWSIVEKRGFADIYIYFESDRNLADFSIYFTEYESFAGCNRQ